MVLSNNIGYTLENVNGVDIMIFWLKNEKDLNYIGMAVAPNYDSKVVKKLLRNKYKNLIIKHSNNFMDIVKCTSMDCSSTYCKKCILSYTSKSNVKSLETILNTMPKDKLYFIVKAMQSTKE